MTSLNNYLRYFYVILVIYISLFTLSSKTFAQDSRDDYQVEYFLNESNGTLQTKVNFNIKITNLRSDVYVKQFTLAFPSSYLIHDIQASDDHVSLTPNISTKNETTEITLQFSNPLTGRNSVNNFHLNFYQNNLFEINGNVWEVIIPTVEDRKDSSYKITVNLPANNSKTISISKPKPDKIIKNQIVWNNPTEKTVYAVFGNVQYYKTSLTYNLVNNQIIPVYQDIAFPPDTLYQKIYIDKITPLPIKVYSDEDGNYLGRYLLKPEEKKIISLEETIKEYSQPRDELLPVISSNFQKEKTYLLSFNKYWNISNWKKIKDISANAKDVYGYVVSNLHYNYKKINTNNQRLGAEAVINNPDQAVCMEFTDLFIALAREKGIYSREIEGYGFAKNTSNRPLSLLSDILHSWPEYYNIKSNFWIPIDPTWENTSGIDYFSSLDLNHIAFVIHGKNSDYPLPAGSYKFETSKDVNITPTSDSPKEIVNLIIDQTNFPNRINDKQLSTGNLSIKNSGNTYIWNKNLYLKSDDLDINPSIINIDSIAPYETKKIAFTYRVKQTNNKQLTQIEIVLPDNKRIDEKINIIPYNYELSLKISFILLLFITLILFIIYKRKRHDK